ncbi:YafY family protein [Pseudonocardia sp. ICBG162]|uniref:helix-turn-helix transcriptional regulator n=1 Tax=Pseudonocardia sp. ICBG162 TaxID=2846761 RepID=UPI001CF69E82|nr:HTH domain-containing protein [Pseudonocardia sp. ICBG162]
MQPRVQLHQVVPLVERQYAVIEHLRARHPKYTTVAQLADLVGVSPRTIERDAARLRAAGVPLDVVTGARGGYRVASREHDRSVSLTPGEVSALLAALVAVGPFTAGVAQSAFVKLIAALEVPPNQDRTPPRLRRGSLLES